VCYGNYRSFVLLQVLFQPVNAFCIQVVGRLVEQQDVRFLQQQTAQSHTAAFTCKKKLLEKQKEGKKKMRQLGSVTLPSEAFTAVLKLDSDS
jgi:GTP-binding protein LepA